MIALATVNGAQGMLMAKPARNGYHLAALAGEAELASDVFVDVGSGRGRVCCAARYTVKQVVGVDLSEALCQVARENARRMRGRRAPISVETSLAQNFDYSAATVLSLFNPFGAATLGLLLEKIGRDLRGSVRIAYANPGHDDVFQRQPWLERTGHWDAETSAGEHSVSFYRSR